MYTTLYFTNDSVYKSILCKLIFIATSNICSYMYYKQYPIQPTWMPHVHSSIYEVIISLLNVSNSIHVNTEKAESNEI